MQAALERGYNGGDVLVTGWHRMGYVVGCGVLGCGVLQRLPPVRATGKSGMAQWDGRGELQVDARYCAHK